MRGLPRVFWFLWIGALLNRLGGFVYTFLALYLTEARHFSVAHAGAVVSLYGVGSFAAAPIGGYLADRIGRRRTMLASFVLGAAAMVQLGLARASWHIALAAPLVGLFCDLFRPAQQATVADVVPEADRTRAYGYIYWAVNVGFSGAAVIAGLLSARSFTWLFFADAVTTLLFGIIVYLRVPETHPERHGRARPDPRLPLTDRTFVTFMLAQFPITLVSAQGFSTLPLDMAAHGVNNNTYGLLLAMNGILIILFQPLALRHLGRFRRGRVLALAALFQAIGFGLTGFGAGAGWYALTIVIWTTAELLYSPVCPALVSDLAPISLRGSYQGAWMMSWGAAIFLAPLIGSFVLERYGSRALWASCFAICLLSAAIHLAIIPARRRRLAEQQDGSLAREDGIAA